MPNKQLKTLAELKKLKPIIKNINSVHNDLLTITDKIALWITNKVGTFNFVIFTIILCLTPFAIPALLPIVQFISSAFLQLTLLPLIMIGQNLQARHSEIAADGIFELTKKLDQEIDIIKDNQEKILQILSKK